MQHRQGRLVQLHPRRGKQLPRLGHGEPQVPGAELGQPALQPQPVQPQPHVMPGRQHKPQPRRGPHQQQLQLPQRVRAQLVHVIDHQPQPLFQRRQVTQQPLRQRPPIQLRRPGHRPHQPGPRTRRPQRPGHRQPEPLRVPLLPPRRHPRRPARQPRPGDPRPQQHRLAAARRRRHHRHPRRPPQPPEQGRTGHRPARVTATAGHRARPRRRSHTPDHPTRRSGAVMSLTSSRRRALTRLPTTLSLTNRKTPRTGPDPAGGMNAAANPGGRRPEGHRP